MIHIFYRDTSHNKVHFDQFEWMTYEKCFKSLLDTIDDCKLTVMFDGDIEGHYVKKYQNKYNIVQIEAGSDFISNTKTFEYISKLDYIKNDDIIGIFENDYLYLPWVQDVLYAYQSNINFQMLENTYLSLFNHLDKLIFNNPERTDEWGMYKDLKSQIYLGLTREWRSCPNTCASFLLSKQVFDMDLDIHLSGEADNSRFNILVNERNRMVISPIPTLATHTNRFFAAPHIDWKRVNDNINLL